MFPKLSHKLTFTATEHVCKSFSAVFRVDLSGSAPPRFRHWKQIAEELQCPLDPTSADFTLEKIVSQSFHTFADKISDISGAASKELFIEQVLKNFSQQSQAA